jgi:hypothetical protein
MHVQGCAGLGVAGREAAAHVPFDYSSLPLPPMDLVQAEALAEPISIATANGGLVQAHFEVGCLAVIQQAKFAVKAKVLNKTLKGIDLIVGMDCL